MEYFKEQESTTEEQIEGALIELLQYGESLEDTAFINLQNVVTFQEEGILNRNRGVVLRMSDGTEFQISIIQSR